MAFTAAHHTPRTNVRLGGFLGKKYGKRHRFLLDTGSPSEAAKALEINHPGFARDVAELEARGMRIAIFKNGRNISEDELDLRGARELIFMPVITGSKRAGTLQTVVGAVLIAAAFVLSFTPFAGASPFLYQMGGVMVAGGVIQMLSPQAKGLSQSAAPENLPSYAFGSAKNTTASGNPVPICIGERRWGGAIISASIEAQDKT